MVEVANTCLRGNAAYAIAAMSAHEKGWDYPLNRIVLVSELLAFNSLSRNTYSWKSSISWLRCCLMILIFFVHVVE
ncbi:hypothetical protein KIN20_020332 [Parelaphostrongylus tenuis]|uniref:Uncharacterized protein n=1 Tax=Parelaphostrongylus tenuis TaxID=148309 RepID=A0AAD5N6E0_PARTN|nr:hypothetical protein KIN20_020332 [Parelaphostrongylus tenuis]